MKTIRVMMSIDGRFVAKGNGKEKVGESLFINGQELDVEDINLELQVEHWMVKEGDLYLAIPP